MYLARPWSHVKVHVTVDVKVDLPCHMLLLCELGGRCRTLMMKERERRLTMMKKRAEGVGFRV